MVVEVRVTTSCCAGCATDVENAIRKLRGVHRVDVNPILGKVTVTGPVDQWKVLRAVRRTGRAAELWPYPYQPDPLQPYSVGYNRLRAGRLPTPPAAGSRTANLLNLLTGGAVDRNSYNYRVHGYNHSHHRGYHSHDHHSHGHLNGTSGLLNDDNPHGCSVM